MEREKTGNVKYLLLLVLLVNLVGLPSLAMKAWAKGGQGSDNKQLVHPTISQFAIYLLPGYEGNPLSYAKNVVRYKFRDIRVVGRPELYKATVPSVHIRLLKDLKKYRPPSRQSMKYFGRGVTRTETELIQGSQQALVLDFVYDALDQRHILRQSADIMAQVSARYKKLPVWDEQTRLLFGHRVWTAKLVKGWQENIPNIENHITIHAYKKGKYVRAVSLGMEKFGLPNLVVNGYQWSISSQMGTLLNLVGQHMVEGRLPSDRSGHRGEMEIDVSAIRLNAMRNKVRKSLIEKAKGKGTIILVKAARDEGDPAGPLFEITFPKKYQGKTRQEQQYSFMNEVFGKKDPVTMVRDRNVAMAQARKRARAKLPGLQKDFNKGLNPGETISVKLPFKSLDGRIEWMWVGVTKWHGDEVEGILNNDPFFVKRLQAGTVVRGKTRDIFDYIRRFPGGRSEGNESGKVLQRMQ